MRTGITALPSRQQYLQWTISEVELARGASGAAGLVAEQVTVVLWSSRVRLVMRVELVILPYTIFCAGTDTSLCHQRVN